MTLHHLIEPPPEWLGQALEGFEQHFLYPLGADDFFRISHGPEYLPFFQAMGKATIHVTESKGQVLGTLAQVERGLACRVAEGMADVSLAAHYLCDLKVLPAARGSRVLARLMEAVRGSIEPHASHSCYAVVMGGTGRLPTDYTGRLRVPAFRKLGEIMILRLTNEGKANRSEGVSLLSREEFEALQRDLPAMGYSATGGSGAQRSMMPPLFMAEVSGRACGRLEDTRRGKRLFHASGSEMVSAHLSGFRYSTVEAGAALLRGALDAVHELNVSALFVAVPLGRASALCDCLRGLKIQQAPASVYGYGLREDLEWWVDTAEI